MPVIPTRRPVSFNKCEIKRTVVVLPLVPVTATTGIRKSLPVAERVSIGANLKIGSLLETEQHDIGDILRESLAHEKVALSAYYELLKVAEGIHSVLLEEYAREMIVQEELHLDEVNKMLRKPGDLEPFKQ